MKNLVAIYVRDFKGYFFSFVAYGVVAIFLLLCGYFFASAMSYFSLYSFQMSSNPYYQGQEINLTEAVLGNLFFNYSVMMLLMIPVVSMRTFAEEEKSRTSELLFTYPVTESQVVLGKFLALLAVFLTMIAPTLLYLILVVRVGGVLEGGVVFSGYMGLVLLGVAFVALGMFCSSLTENQIVAAIASFGFLLFFWVIGWSAHLAPPEVGKFIEGFSLLGHFENFPRGIIETRDVLYYLFFALFFVILTIWRLERRRWKP